jgi:hypothetical protein
MRAVRFVRIALKVVMQNDGDFVGVNLPHFASGIHMFTVCDILKVR